MYAAERSIGVPDPPVVGGFKSTLTKVDCALLPGLVPVTVTEYGFAARVNAAVLLAESVKEVVVEFTDEKEAVTPLGNPDAVRLTALLNPLIPLMVIVLVAVEP